MRRSSLFFVLFFLFVLACQVSEEEKIDRILNQRQEALQKKDLSLYLSCISKAYQDKEEDFERLQKRIKRYFDTFDRISYSCWDRFFQIDGETAIVTQQFYLEVQKAEKKNHYSGREVLFLKQEGKGWRIVKGL
jgi:hypothetical protein